MLKRYLAKKKDATVEAINPDQTTMLSIYSLLIFLTFSSHPGLLIADSFTVIKIPL